MLRRSIWQRCSSSISRSYSHAGPRLPLLSLKPIKPNDEYLSCSMFNSKGNVVSVSERFQKWKFLKDHSLYPRDLRKIDSSAVDMIPSIVVKPRNCIVVNMLHVKSLITKDSVYVFDTVDAKAAWKLGVLMYDLESKLSTSSPGSMQNYEHRALESILINIMSTLEVEYNKHYQICSQILIDLENEVNREKLRDLLIKSKNLSLFYQRSLLIRDVLDELLESDEDMASMYLSNSKKTDKDDIVDLEMLLETYYTQCDEYVQQSESLIQDIKSTEEIVNIILDANRNSLMLLELKVTIYTLGFTIMALLPTFYGMNLKNFIEESIYGFFGVVGISLLAGLFVTRLNFKMLQNVTKLSMSTGASSRKALTDSEGSKPHKIARKLKNVLYGQSPATDQEKFKMEDRLIIWKWLMGDKKQ